MIGAEALCSVHIVCTVNNGYVSSFLTCFHFVTSNMFIKRAALVMLLTGEKFQPTCCKGLILVLQK